jgi:hypothetical protein
MPTFYGSIEILKTPPNFNDKQYPFSTTWLRDPATNIAPKIINIGRLDKLPLPNQVFSSAILDRGMQLSRAMVASINVTSCDIG